MGRKKASDNDRKGTVEACQMKLNQDLLTKMFDVLRQRNLKTVDGNFNSSNRSGQIIFSCHISLTVTGESLAEFKMFNAWSIFGQPKPALYIVGAGRPDFKGKPFYVCPVCIQKGVTPKKSKWLYFTQEKMLLACRKCAGLTYASRQNSRNTKRDTAYLAKYCDASKAELRELCTVKEITELASDMRSIQTLWRIPSPFTGETKRTMKKEMKQVGLEAFAWKAVSFQQELDDRRAMG